MQRSFLPSASTSTTPFPLNNLPYGVFSTSTTDPNVCVALGDFVVSLTRLASRFPELFPGPLLPSAQAADVFARPSLNPFLALGRPVWSEVRSVLQRAFAAQSALRDVQDLIGDVLVPHDTVTMHLPVVVGDYTDFYSSRQHATNVGTMFRGKDNALPPNWLHMPIGYHGRASSVVVSGTNVVRPCGQLSPDPTAAPTFGPCKLLDFELEMATIIGGPGNPLGKRVRMEEAGDAVFGFALMNDWSARDIQKWEYVPLGPFGAKNFATTMSPWIVTLEALQPFREPAPVQDPAVLPYLRAPTPAPATVPHAMDVHCLYNIDLSVSIKPSGAKSATSVCASNFRNLYWTVAQQITHHTVTGCNVRPGDLMASGTISGAEPSSFGSMLELSWKGTKKVQVEGAEGDETRTFLQDGDTVYLNGECHGDGFVIGFGDCAGELVPAINT